MRVGDQTVTTLLIQVVSLHYHSCIFFASGSTRRALTSPGERQRWPTNDIGTKLHTRDRQAARRRRDETRELLQFIDVGVEH